MSISLRKMKASYEDDWIVRQILSSNESFFKEFRADIKNQLELMPQMENRNLTIDIQEADDNHFEIMLLGGKLLTRNFIH